jgi:hypothetical protein
VSIARAAAHVGRRRRKAPQVVRLAMVVAFFTLGATFAVAQEGGPDPNSVRMRIGVLYVNPTISLANIGVDNNVFYDPDELSPKRDFTLTLTPASDVWLRVGPTWLSGSIKEDIIWFQEYASERTANTSSALTWRVPLNRVVMRTGVTYANVRDRPGFEIDARVRRTDIGYNGSIEYRALSRTSFVASAARRQVDFDKDAVFLASNLEYELNRVSTSYGAGVKYQATALTAFTVTVSRLEDRFEFSPLRDSDSTTTAFNVSFDPTALIKGSATVGYRSFQPLSPGLAAYNGATAALNLSYTLLGATRFRVAAVRDIQYSYDVNRPYYLQTGADFSIAQQIFGPLDVVGRFGRQNLAYTDRSDVESPNANRVDHVESYGGGIGYHFGRDLRLGFDVDQSKRLSDVARRQYDDVRIGSSLTYGF